VLSLMISQGNALLALNMAKAKSVLVIMDSIECFQN